MIENITRQLEQLPTGDPDYDHHKLDAVIIYTLKLFSSNADILQEREIEEVSSLLVLKWEQLGSLSVI